MRKYIFSRKEITEKSGNISLSTSFHTTHRTMERLLFKFYKSFPLYVVAN